MEKIRKICFMVIPYGVKATLAAEGSGAPAKVDFDRLWQAAIRPAIEDIGYAPVRADQDLGALIIQEMIERLALSDLVVADLTTPNGNVYYEVGVRHVAKRNGCVLIAAEWAQPLFDMTQMRQIRYPLPEESIQDETAQKIRGILSKAIPMLASGESPFHGALPGYPDIDVNRATALRDTLRRLSEFQAAVNAARSMPEADRRVRALELQNLYTDGGPVPAAVALELLYLLRDSADWNGTLEFINSLTQDVQQLRVVQEQKALAQSKAGDHHTAIGALRELIRVGGDTSERRGLLGGRYKKLWASETDAAQKAHYLGQAILEYEKGMKLDLNDYYPASNLTRLYRERNKPGDDDRARAAATITVAGCERAALRNPDDKWLKPTLLGAAFDAGDVTKARELADQVINEGAAPFHLETTIADLRLAIKRHDEVRAHDLGEIVKELEALVR